MDTLKIRLLQSVSGSDYSYAGGSIEDAPAHIAKDLVKAGFATLVSVTEPSIHKSAAETATDKRRTTKRKK